MKNIITTTAVILLLSGLIFTACKKDEPMQNEEQTQSTLSDHSAIVLKLIKAFDMKMNSSLKDNELIELDSVIWNVEALQNYSYAFPDSSTREFLVFKDNYTLSFDQNQMVLLSDVQALQSQMESDYLARYNSIEEVEKILHFCDVALDSVSGNTAYISATHGFGLIFLLGSYPPFAEDDDWIWGTLGEENGVPPAGKCDGTMQGVSDGSNELEWRLNYPYSQPTSPYRRFTDLEIVYTAGFGVYTTNIDYCMTNDQLEYWLEFADDNIYTYIPDGGSRPIGKDFVKIEIVDTAISDSQGSGYGHYHHITYGIPYCGTYSPE